MLSEVRAISDLDRRSSPLARRWTRSPLRPGIAQPRFRRLLYRGTLLIAAALLFVVLAAPWLPLVSPQHVGGKLWQLFGQDDTLRQVAVISAVGLWTAAVGWFRSRTVQ